MTMETEFKCIHCEKRNEMEPRQTDVISCAHCGKSFGALESFAAQKVISHCGFCGCRDLYSQKDFNRKVGCAIAIIGAVLAPFTKLISLLVCALIDLILYKTLPLITICYRCKAVYRGFTKNPAHEGFNLGINDRYRAAEKAGTL